MEAMSERGRKVTTLAQQLRVLYNELADQPQGLRLEQLRDSVQRELAILPPHERESFLSALSEQFPMWNEGATTSSQPAPAAASKALPTDPMAVAGHLLELAASLGTNARAALTSKLVAGGLIPVPPPSSGNDGAARVEVREVIKEVVREVPTLAGIPEESLTELKRFAGVPVEAPIRSDRVIELCVMLADFTSKLEPWAVAYWQEIGRDAKNQVGRVLTKAAPNERQGTLARFLEGHEGATREALFTDILRLRSLVSLLLKGVLNASSEFSRDHMKRYSPDAVQNSAEKGTFTESQAAKNWKQYVKLMEGIDAGSLERRLKGIIAGDVDKNLSQALR